MIEGEIGSIIWLAPEIVVGGVVFLSDKLDVDVGHRDAEAEIPANVEIEAEAAGK